MRGALYCMNVEVIDLLVVGLPVAYFADKKVSLVKLAEGEHALGRGRKVLVKRVIGDRNTCPFGTASAWLKQVLNHPWAARVTATTTPWPRINGLYKAKLIHRPAPCKTTEAVATSGALWVATRAWCADRSASYWFFSSSECRSRWDQPKVLNPGIKDSCVLPRSKMGRVVDSTRKEKVLRLQPGLFDPSQNGLASRRTYFELHFPLRLCCMTIARDATWSPWQTSRALSVTRSQPRSLLSIPRLKSASSRTRFPNEVARGVPRCP